MSGYENTDDAFIDGHTDPIATRINGTVANVYVENTFRVRRGQLLLELDSRDNQVAKDQAYANYDQAQAPRARRHLRCLSRRISKERRPSSLT